VGAADRLPAGSRLAWRAEYLGQRFAYPVQQPQSGRDRAVGAGRKRPLREIGVRVALDDFGIGYSSLGYLRSFPFDRTKIDQSFIRGASRDAVGRAIVRAVAALGQSLGMATVAEGVETEEQMASVASDGCTDVQGYLISRPIPPEQIASFLSSRTRSPD
jgi:EAL domain-containing protein (putative c-di-GMP-specific phosphodiesterase class I)